jgi:hypothetical protein
LVEVVLALALIAVLPTQLADDFLEANAAGGV